MNSIFVKKVPGRNDPDIEWTEYHLLDNGGEQIHPQDLEEYAQSCITGFGETAGRRCVTWANAWVNAGGKRATLMLECIRDV